MAHKIIWSPSAKRSFDELISFLEKKWEKKVIANLFLDLNNSLELIAVRPTMFPLISKRKGLRKCVLKRKTLLLYRIKQNHIELVMFIDSRRNPLKYKF